MFLALTSSAVVVVRGVWAARWGYLYLDDYGEADPGLARSLPLFSILSPSLCLYVSMSLFEIIFLCGLPSGRAQVVEAFHHSRVLTLRIGESD